MYIDICIQSMTAIGNLRHINSGIFSFSPVVVLMYFLFVVFMARAFYHVLWMQTIKHTFTKKTLNNLLKIT